MGRLDDGARGLTRRRGLLGVVGGACVAALVGCGVGDAAPPPPADESPPEERVDGLDTIEWVHFDDANSGLIDAERQLAEAQSEAASASLERAGAALERLAGKGDTDDARRLLASATELESLARDFPEDVVEHRHVLGEVEGRALVALARHHVMLAERAGDGGDAAGAGRHLLTAVHDVEEGFRVSEVEMPPRTSATLLLAEGSARRWIEGETDDEGTTIRTRSGVRAEAERLSNALGERRR